MDPANDTASAESSRAQPGAPDVMNDPAFDTNSKGKRKSVDESDTCRICRAEGSVEEPLFYPCKCSGSIKFVHQNCLMEWLSHSQKKHCELCKTPFRFTKLYHPHMPSRVPLPVFLRQAAVHSWKSFLTWSRFLLVFFVWVAWLPWCMRTIFRGLFWIGDGGWINWQETQRRSFLAVQELEKLAKEGTTPANQGFSQSRNIAASAVVSHMAKALPQMFSPAGSRQNMSEPSLLKFFKRFLQGFSIYSTNEALPSPSNVNSTVMAVATRRSSWLSDFTLLKSLTRSPTLNNILIDTLEGQLITLMVVISSILIFLIREWVVQQQPGMNIGAGAPADAAVAGQAEEVPMLQQLARQHAEQRLRGGDQDDAPEGDENEVAQMPEHPGQARVIARPRARRATHTLDTAVTGPQESENTTEPGPEAESPFESIFGPNEDSDNNILGNTQEIGLTSQQRPGMPTKDTLDRVTAIRRTIDEQSRAAGHSNWPGVKVFMELWDRAEKKPSEVLKIIEEEGRSDELSWIVAAMRRLEETPVNIGHNQDPELIERSQERQDEPEYLVNSGNAQDTDQGMAVYQNDGTAISVVEDINNARVATDTVDVQNNANDRVPQYLEMDASRNDDIETTITPIIQDDERHLQVPQSTFSWHSDPPNTETDPAESSRNSRQPFQSLSDSLPDKGASNELDGTSFHPELVKYDSQGISGTTVESGDTESPNVDVIDQEHGIEEPRAELGFPVGQDVRNSVPPDSENASLGLFEKGMDWLWGGLEQVPDRTLDQNGVDDEHVVDDLADEAPFVPVEHGQPRIDDANNVAFPGPDHEVVAAAVQAVMDQNDAEAVEDGEDLEGIMELVGMQGPLAGLIQNGMFCALLISLAIFFGMWIPYVAGKVFLLFLANPVSLLIKLPLRWTSISADLIIDMGIFTAGLAYYWVDAVVRFLCGPVRLISPFLGKLNENRVLADFAKDYAESALERLADTFIETGGSLSESDIPTFSILAHESLRVIERRSIQSIRILRDFSIAIAAALSAGTCSGWYGPLSEQLASYMKTYMNVAAMWTRDFLALVPSVLKINPLRVSLNIPQRTRPLDLSLAYWDTKDRVLAVIFGYVFFSLLGTVYLRISTLIRGTKPESKVQGPLADALYQAGGVMKVILIISIEMIVFPLYCGLLLDLALLPLCGNVTVVSRLDFTLNSPYTSIFIHWFVGTCYMFHFALFVSMCRKIMRTGVLCRSFPTPFSPNANGQCRLHPRS